MKTQGYVTGSKVRVLTVVDTFSRFSPVIDSRFTYWSENVVEALDPACLKLGDPARNKTPITLMNSGDTASLSP